MLKQRIITAIVLLVGLFAALFYLPFPYWAGLMALVSAVAAWEWGGLAGLKQHGRLVFGGVVLLLCCVWSIYILSTQEVLALVGTSRYLNLARLRELPYWFFERWALYLSMAFWCLVAPFWLWRRWSLNLTTWWGRGILLVLGGCLILATWFVFIHLYWRPHTLLLVLSIAWVSDISAYFVGRKFGGKKLAPEISPGKTWAGVWGALAGVAIYGMLGVVATVGFTVSRPILWFVGALFFIFFAVLGIMGDLFESLLKRQAGIKDSSNILPGHGGVLDRIDSLIAILPCYAVVLYLIHLATTYYSPTPE
ncbi:MAG: phosphatidate cytidylyltransferase [Zoogloeaceae bacterium]|jgi:phosphatidate cytidylyltransferase|nr:phosphatidate cytidylyltransferase [Zoogloeaceae bacterium]